MDTTGRHLLAEYHECDVKLLGDKKRIQSLLEHAVAAAGATIIGSVFHKFSPTGVSGVILIAESHMSIHTWPEHEYAAVDLYTCGECFPEKAHEALVKGLGARSWRTVLMHRGTQNAPEVIKSTRA